MKKHPLASDGTWAILREAHELTEGGQRSIRKAIARVSRPTRDALARNEQINERNAKLPQGAPREELAEIPFTPEDLDALDDANDACVLALVTSWGYDFPIGREGLMTLPTADYRRLQELCAPAVKSATVDFTPTPEAQVNQESPFGSSSGSSGLSVVETSTASYPTPSAPTA